MTLPTDPYRAPETDQEPLWSDDDTRSPMVVLYLLAAIGIVGLVVWWAASR